MIGRSLCPDDGFSTAEDVGAGGQAQCALAERQRRAHFAALSGRDRLARVPRVFYAWLAALYVVWTLRATWFYDAVDAHIGPLPRAIEAHALALFVWALPALYVARQVFGARFAEATRLTLPRSLEGECGHAPGALRAWVGSFVAMGLWFGGVLVFERYTSGRHLSLDGGATLRLWGSISLVPVAEEIVFRGLILSVLERRLCLYRSNLLTTLLFVAAALPAWLHGAAWRAGGLDDVVVRCLMLAAFSLFLGALTLRTRSIAPAIVAHLVNGALVALLA